MADDRYNRDNSRGQGYGRDRDFGREGGRDYGRQPQGYDYDQRGFFDRAGDEVRSWFGDDEAERRRRMDERYDDRYGNRGDNRGVFGQRESYGRDDYGRSSYGGGDYGRSGYGQGGGSQSGYGQNDNRQGGYGQGSQGRGDFGRSGSDRGQDYGRSGGFGGSDYGSDRFRDHDDQRRYGQGSVSNYGQRDMSRDNRQDQHEHDPHYRNWRDRQMEGFDRDYQDYRRENQSRFENDFSQWRTKREGQRRHLSSVREHQEVVGSDGQHVGTVDHVQGDQIKLARNDKDAGGQHHFIPCSWIDSVDDKVKISKSAAEAKQHWTDEARNSGSSMFGRDDSSRSEDRGSSGNAGQGGRTGGMQTSGGQTTGGQTASPQSISAQTSGSTPTGADRT